MDQPDRQDAYGRMIFKVLGGCFVALFLVSNPLVLRPRFWQTSLIWRSMALDSALILIGVGFIRLRRWAALLAWVFAGSLSLALLISGQPFLSIPILIPLIFTVMFWRTLTWGNVARDSLLLLVALGLSAAVHYAAFLLRRP